MKLGLIQMRVTPGAVDRNLSRATALVEDAARTGVDLVLLPEALPFGWTDPSARDLAEDLPHGRHFQYFAALARRHGIHLCTGLIERNETKIFNAAVLISPSGDLLLHHRKIHELDFAHALYALGDRLGVVDTPLGRIGLMICADGFAPGQVLARSLGLMGAELILSPSAWAVPPQHDPVAAPYGKLWLDNYGPVAREFGLWVAGCSNVGLIESGPWATHKCIGCSLIVGPTGRAEFRGSYGEAAEEIILAEISLSPHQRPNAAT